MIFCEKILLRVLPIFTIALVWLSTSGASPRFYAIVLGSYFILSIIGEVFACVSELYIRPTLISHATLGFIYGAMAVCKWASFNTGVGDHEANLSGMLWISFYVLAAFFALVIFGIAWISTSFSRRRMGD